MNRQNLAHYFPDEVKKIFQIFLKEGDEIRLVGGCVRDLLIGKMVHDFDFATKFLPDDIIAILEKNNVKAIPTGKKFGTITAVLNRKNFEITTLRKDLNNDGRHCEPEFVDDYLLDASRRDFTINALYLDDKGTIMDYFNGIADLQNKHVRFIGDATSRIEEDYLRVLRFFRFSCDYADMLDTQGFAACVQAKEHISTLSRERIRTEFLKMLSSQNRDNILTILQAIDESDVARHIFAMGFGVENLQKLFAFESKYGVSSDVELKIAALFIDHITDLKEFGVAICATNKEKKYLQYLLSKLSQIKAGMTRDDIIISLAFDDKKYVRDAYILSALYDNCADVSAHLELLDHFTLPDFPLNGHDLKAYGIVNEDIKYALEKAKKFWALNGFAASKDELLKYLGLYT